MSTISHRDFDDYEYQPDEEGFDPRQKILRSREGLMPVGNATSSLRGRHRNKANQRRNSLRVNGIHRRRVRKMS